MFEGVADAADGTEPARTEHRVAGDCAIVLHVERVLDPLLAPAPLFTWATLESAEDLPPRKPGTYAWYFDLAAVPANVTGDAHTIAGRWVLLYVGIAPAKPSPHRTPSRKTLRSRIRFHFRGNARGSTLRLTLGCLLGIDLVRVGSGDRLTFGEREAELSRWMADHARVCWVEHDYPWELEDQAIETLNLPLNLAGNQRHPFHATLSALRRDARQRALR